MGAFFDILTGKLQGGRLPEPQPMQAPDPQGAVFDMLTGRLQGGRLPEPPPMAQPEEAKQDNPLDAIIQGLLTNPPKESAMEPPDQYIGRRVSEMVHGPQGPPQTKKGKAVAFLENILTGAAAGPKYIPPALRAREYAEREYQLHQTNERARIQEARSAWMQQIAAAQQARLAEKDEKTNRIAQELADIKAGKLKLDETAEERKSREGRERFGIAKDEQARKWMMTDLQKDRDAYTREFALAKDPEKLLAYAEAGRSDGSVSEDRYQAIMKAYRTKIENDLKLKATSAPGRAAQGSFGAPLKDEEGKVVGYFNPRTKEFVPAPMEGLRTTANIPTSSERTAAGYLLNMTEASKVLDSMESEIEKLNLFGQAKQEHFHNVLQSEQGQKYIQAQDQWIENNVRQVSGAAVRPEEFAGYRRIYFMQPGDTQDVLRQKQAMRKVSEKATGIRAGRAAPKPGAPFAGGAGRTTSPTAPNINPSTGRRVIRGVK